MASIWGRTIQSDAARESLRGLPPLGARRLALIALVASVAIPAAILLLALNAMLVVRAFINVAAFWQGSAVDWSLLNSASHSPDPYAWATYRWSPVAAALLAPITSMGILTWRVAQLAALAVFRDWRVVIGLMLTAPFWLDFVGGDAMIFVAAAGWAAYRGSRVGTLAWFLLAVLMPRPLMLPLTAWLLWRRPETRSWFTAIFLVHGALVLGSGHTVEWVGRLLSTSSREIAHHGNFAISHLIGPVWVPIGLALGALLTWKGRLGLASLAVQPYLFGYYLLMLVLEIGPGVLKPRGGGGAPRSPGAHRRGRRCAS
ncbi:MAG: hypothetical protein M3R32_00800 [Chloroflexota bacterium]|nr:hypothetical protein [Chloroflexota bacterium]